MIAVFWGVMKCSVVEIYRRFGGGCCQHLHGSLLLSVCHLFVHSAVAYPGILFGGGVQQIQLRTEDRENGDLGAVAP